jgi:hypothetical protein
VKKRNVAQNKFRKAPLSSPDFGPKVLICLLLPILVSFPVAAEEVKQDSNSDSGAEAEVTSPFNYAGVSYRSNNRRDPFLNPLLLSKKSKKNDEEISRGLPPPGIAGTYIAQLAFEGTSFREDRRLAIVRGADKRAYFLKEGDRLFDGYLKTIQIDSITLVRETKLRSGRILTQTVTKRLRRP